MNGMRFIDICVWCLLLKCTSILLVHIELWEDKSILLKLMSRTCYQWYIYLLTVSAYVFKWYSCLVIYVWMHEYLSYHFSLLYSDSYLFMLNIWVAYYAICFSQRFHLTFYTKWFIFIEFFSHSSWMIFITNFHLKSFFIA